MPTKVSLVKVMVFPVAMYGCESGTIKKAECWKLDAFELWCWRRLESPLDCKEIKPVSPKGNQSWVLLEGLMLKLKLQSFGPLMWRADSFEKTLMQGKIEGRRRGWQRMTWVDGITDSRWKWIWASSESWWWTGKPGVLHGVSESQTWLSDWTELKGDEQQGQNTDVSTFGLDALYILTSQCPRNLDMGPDLNPRSRVEILQCLPPSGQIRGWFPQLCCWPITEATSQQLIPILSCSPEGNS